MRENINRFPSTGIRRNTHLKQSNTRSSDSKRSQPARQAAHQPPGVNWLKYAGIGPSREQGRDVTKKVSGEEVNSLGSLEAEVMGILWEIGRPAGSMEVAEIALYKRRAQGDEPASFSTIATTLRRLADKGLLKVTKGDQQRTPFYAPTVGREEMAARILNNVSVKLLGRPLVGLLPRLVGGMNPAKAAAKQGADDDQSLNQLLKALEDVAERNESPAKK